MRPSRIHWPSLARPLTGCAQRHPSAPPLRRRSPLLWLPLPNLIVAAPTSALFPDNCSASDFSWLEIPALLVSYENAGRLWS